MTNAAMVTHMEKMSYKDLNTAMRPDWPSAPEDYGSLFPGVKLAKRDTATGKKKIEENIKLTENRKNWKRLVRSNFGGN